jgi:hypothetical protein
MKLRGLAVALLAAAALGIAAAAGAFAGGSHPRVVQGAPPPPSAAELRTLERDALDAARGAGDAHPTDGVVVPSTRQVAERVDAGAVVDSNQPAYFVLVHGHFTSNMAPPGGTPPRGTILTLTIDARTNRSTDSGIEDGVPNLDAIGKPEPLPLSGNDDRSPVPLKTALTLTKHVPCRFDARHRVGRSGLGHFHAVTAVSCTEGFRTYPGQGQWEVLIRRVAVGSVWRLQRAFERQDEHHVPKNLACAAVLIVIPIPTFVDDQGRWLAPRRWPVDGCGEPLGYDYKRGPPVRWRVVWVHRIRQLVTAAAVAANCQMRVGNTVAWAGPPRNAPAGAPLFDRTPTRLHVCIYRTRPTNFATGYFVRGFRLGVARTRRLLRALTGRGPKRGCPKQRTFAAINANRSVGATVELGGCYRVATAEGARTANPAVVRAILGAS